MSNDLLKPKDAVLVFAAFASAYFISTLIRAITATLSPVLTQEVFFGICDGANSNGGLVG